MAYNKIRLEEKADYTGKLYYWIYINDVAEIPIYSDKERAETAYNQIVEFYKNPHPVKVLASETIYSDIKI